MNEADSKRVEVELKECREALDNSDIYLHEALDRLGVPSSKRFPGQARDGVIARVEDALNFAGKEVEQLKKLKQGYYNEATEGWTKYRQAEHQLTAERTAKEKLGDEFVASNRKLHEKIEQFRLPMQHSPDNKNPLPTS